MYNNTYHQGAGYPPPSHDGDDGGNTAVTTQGGQKTNSHHSLTPVTIRQLLNAKQVQNEDEYLVDGKKLSLITIVGVIVAVKDVTHQLRLEIDDGTGRIDMIQFLDDTIAVKTSWREGTYVRIIGHLRTFQGVRTIVKIVLNLINHDKFNEITYHFLEVIYVHLYNTKGGYKLSGLTNANTSGSTGVNSYAASDANGLNFLQNAIIDLLRKCSHQEGTTTGFIRTTLNHCATDDQIYEALQFLLTKGLIYNGCDEDNWVLFKPNI